MAAFVAMIAAAMVTTPFLIDQAVLVLSLFVGGLTFWFASRGTREWNSRGLAAALKEWHETMLCRRCAAVFVPPRIEGGIAQSIANRR